MDGDERQPVLGGSGLFNCGGGLKFTQDRRAWMSRKVPAIALGKLIHRHIEENLMYEQTEFALAALIAVIAGVFSFVAPATLWAALEGFISRNRRLRTRRFSRRAGQSDLYPGNKNVERTQFGSMGSSLGRGRA